MLDKVGTITKDVGPRVKIVGAMSMRALDTLPLPVLLILFLVCLALLQFPSYASPLLPVHSPVELDKSRLSPLPGFPSQSDISYFSPSPSAHAQGVSLVIDSSVSPTAGRLGRGRGRFKTWPGRMGKRSPSGRILDVLEEVDEKYDEQV